MNGCVSVGGNLLNSFRQQPFNLFLQPFLGSFLQFGCFCWEIYQGSDRLNQIILQLLYFAAFFSLKQFQDLLQRSICVAACCHLQDSWWQFAAFQTKHLLLRASPFQLNKFNLGGFEWIWVTAHVDLLSLLISHKYVTDEEPWQQLLDQGASPINCWSMVSWVSSSLTSLLACFLRLWGQLGWPVFESNKDWRDAWKKLKLVSFFYIFMQLS